MMNLSKRDFVCPFIIHILLPRGKAREMKEWQIGLISCTRHGTTQCLDGGGHMVRARPFINAVILTMRQLPQVEPRNTAKAMRHAIQSLQKTQISRL